jgi:hypothetical protein
MVMRLMLSAVTGLAIGVGGAYAVESARHSPPLVEAAYDADQAQIPPRRIVIGLDISKSNPLIADPQFATKVAARIANEVRKLGFASEVHVRTFGTFDAASNGFYYDTLISVRSRPENVAGDIQRLIASTPELISSGKWRAQNNTNILAFLDNVSQSLGCSGIPTTIILASDGIEDSEYVRLGHSDAHLPPPQGKPFAGCAELQILGIGQGTRSPVETDRLRHEWERWASAAGFQKFQGLNDW